MPFTTRSIRVALAAAAVGCAAVSLPTAAIAAPSHADYASQTGRVSPCKSFNMAIWLGLGNGGGAAGTTFYPVEFSNIGRRTCTLFGFPGISAVSISGRQIGGAASHRGRRRLVVLRPGGTAHVILGIIDAGNIARCSLRPGASLKIFAPGQAAATVIPSFTFTACANKSVLVVNAMHPGTGIPGFTGS
jgi:Protein of unknown function (DUF4232)